MEALQLKNFDYSPETRLNRGIKFESIIESNINQMIEEILENEENKTYLEIRVTEFVRYLLRALAFDRTFDETPLRLIERHNYGFGFRTAEKVTEIVHILLRALALDGKPLKLIERQMLCFNIKTKGEDEEYGKAVDFKNRLKTDILIKSGEKFVLSVLTKTYGKNEFDIDFCESLAQTIALLLENRKLDSYSWGRQQMFSVLVRGTTFHFYEVIASNAYLDQLSSNEELSGSPVITQLIESEKGLDYRLSADRTQILNILMKIKRLVQK